MSERSYNPYSGMMKGEHVLLAFSGGVDSTVTAHLLKEASFVPHLVCMRLFGCETSSETEQKAVKAAASLGLEVTFIDVRDRFKEEVMRECWKVFADGRTPNPCVICNRLFKFGLLSEVAEKMNCTRLATGHYAKVYDDARAGRVLAKADHLEKDQSYFLYGLKKETLSKVCFPLGGITKDEVRSVASKLGLPNAETKDSQDVCFAPKGSATPAEFLRTYFDEKARKGDFVDTSGRAIGHHNGVHLYTVGQRKGTGIALGAPAYVKEVRASDGKVVITPSNEDLYSKSMTVDDVNILHPDAEKDVFRGEVRIRYRGKSAPCTVKRNGEKSFLIEFDEPQRAVTPGQAAVIYFDDVVSAGGTIVSGH